MVDAIVFPDGRDWGVVVGTRVELDLVNDGGGCSDRAQCYVA